MALLTCVYAVAFSLLAVTQPACSMISHNLHLAYSLVASSKFALSVTA